MSVREVDGIKVSFCEHATYFESFVSPSMHSTAKATGADLVFLLAEGVKADELTDDEIRVFIAAAQATISEAK